MLACEALTLHNKTMCVVAFACTVAVPVVCASNKCVCCVKTCLLCAPLCVCHHRGSSHHSLPTVAEDDIFSAVGGLELGRDSHHIGDIHQHASTLQDPHNGDASR